MVGGVEADGEFRALPTGLPDSRESPRRVTAGLRPEEKALMPGCAPVLCLPPAPRPPPHQRSPANLHLKSHPPLSGKPHHCQLASVLLPQCRVHVSHLSQSTLPFKVQHHRGPPGQLWAGRARGPWSTVEVGASGCIVLSLSLLGRAAGLIVPMTADRSHSIPCPALQPRGHQLLGLFIL